MKIIERQDPEFEAYWAALLRDHENPTALISQSHFDYRALYLGQTLEKQLCAVVVERDRPVVGTYFELLRSRRGRSLDATATHSALILARDTPAPMRAGAEGVLRKWLADAAVASQIERMVFRDQLIDGGLSPLAHWALDHGASVESEFTQIVDLTTDETTLWRGLTKSCQWAVNWGRKNMTLKVRRDYQALEELRALHLEAAGGATRKAATWELQGEMMANDEAFVVTAELNGGPVVSAALFQLSHGHCYYGVSASDRQLFDKPLSHAIIWEAMRHTRERGCRRFCLGSQVWERFHWHLAAPSRKEVNISKFKRSFGGHSRPEFVITMPMAAREPARQTTDGPTEVSLREVMPAALRDPALSRGERVMLRPLSPEDITPRYLSWFADPEVHRYLEVRAISATEARDYIEEGPTKNTYFMCAICDSETGLHVGNLKIGPIRWQQSVADMVTVIGDKSYWGRQIASDAIGVAVRLAFDVLGIQKLHASMYADNVGSLKAYTRAGWHVEARLNRHSMLDGKPQDTILISQFSPRSR
jgi:RimJ/RimL family protein N-acetyltransferase